MGYYCEEFRRASIAQVSIKQPKPGQLLYLMINGGLRGFTTAPISIQNRVQIVCLSDGDQIEAKNLTKRFCTNFRLRKEVRNIFTFRSFFRLDYLESPTGQGVMLQEFPLQVYFVVNRLVHYRQKEEMQTPLKGRESLFETRETWDEILIEKSCLKMHSNEVVCA